MPPNESQGSTSNERKADQARQQRIKDLREHWKIQEDKEYRALQAKLAEKNAANAQKARQREQREKRERDAEEARRKAAEAAAREAAKQLAHQKAEEKRLEEAFRKSEAEAREQKELEDARDRKVDARRAALQAELNGYSIVNYRDLVPPTRPVIVLQPANEAVRAFINKMFTHVAAADCGKGNDKKEVSPYMYNSIKPQKVYEVLYRYNNVPFNQRTKSPWSCFTGESGDTAVYQDFVCKRDAVRVDMDNLSDRELYGRTECVRTDKALDTRAMDIPAGELDATVNEKLLFHGTSPTAIFSIIKHQFNVDLAGQYASLFGPAVYLAEDPAKSDQYCMSCLVKGRSIKDDGTLREATPNEKVLAKKLNEAQQFPIYQQTYYILVCRAVLGRAAHVNGGAQLHDSHRSPSELRDLLSEKKVYQIGANGALRMNEWDSVIAERWDLVNESREAAARRTAGKALRFREMMVQDVKQVLPLYVVAYTREREMPPPAYTCSVQL